MMEEKSTTSLCSMLSNDCNPTERAEREEVNGNRNAVFPRGFGKQRTERQKRREFKEAFVPRDMNPFFNEPGKKEKAEKKVDESDSDYSSKEEEVKKLKKESFSFVERSDGVDRAKTSPKRRPFAFMHVIEWNREIKRRIGSRRRKRSSRYVMSVSE